MLHKKGTLLWANVCSWIKGLLLPAYRFLYYYIQNGGRCMEPLRPRSLLLAATQWRRLFVMATASHLYLFYSKQKVPTARSNTEILLQAAQCACLWFQEFFFRVFFRMLIVCYCIWQRTKGGEKSRYKFPVASQLVQRISSWNMVMVGRRRTFPSITFLVIHRDLPKMTQNQIKVPATVAMTKKIPNVFVYLRQMTHK